MSFMTKTVVEPLSCKCTKGFKKIVLKEITTFSNDNPCTNDSLSIIDACI